MHRNNALQAGHPCSLHAVSPSCSAPARDSRCRCRCCSWNWDVTEAVHGHNVLGMPDPKLLMLSPGVELFTETEDGFLAAVTQVPSCLPVTLSGARHCRAPVCAAHAARHNAMVLRLTCIARAVSLLAAGASCERAGAAACGANPPLRQHVAGYRPEPVVSTSVSATVGGHVRWLAGACVCVCGAWQ